MGNKKKCSGCGELKSLNEFQKNKCRKDGVQTYCKICCNNIERTKEGIVNRIYKNQKSSSVDRGHKPPFYSLKQLKGWCFNQDSFHKLYDNWVKSNYDRWLTPSVDRKDDNLPYFLDNIQLMAWQENANKAHKDRKSGKLITSQNRVVLQFDKQGNFIKEYYSIRQASRETGTNQSNISQNCLGKAYKSAGGFIWKFK